MTHIYPRDKIPNNNNHIGNLLVKRILWLLVLFILSISAYSASGDIEYVSAVKNYKLRCQQGDYTNAKFEELESIEQINIIGRKLGKAPFISSCKKSDKKPTSNVNNQANLTNNPFEVHGGKTFYFSGQKMTWNDAYDFCGNLSVDGITEWTLPKRDDFETKRKGLIVNLYSRWNVDTDNWKKNPIQYVDGPDTYDVVCQLDAEKIFQTLSKISKKEPGGYSPKEIETSTSLKQAQSNTYPNKSSESYEERSKRIFRESIEYRQGKTNNTSANTNYPISGSHYVQNLVQIDAEHFYDANSVEKLGSIIRLWTYQDITNPKAKFKENDVDRFVYSYKEQVDINCANRTKQSFNGEIYIEPHFSGKAYPNPSDSKPKDIGSNNVVEKMYFMLCPNPISPSSLSQATSSIQTSNSVFAGRCEGYGFQQGTDSFANCIMQMEQAQAQANLEIDKRAQLERSCGFARANGFLAPTRTGHFAESAQNANEAYARCMAGIPPAKSYMINCNQTGNNFTCFAQ